jgi:D-alanyl-D-alanine carboxypeptidase
VQKRQLAFVSGHSEPPGPGRNSAGLGVFRYRTSCGTVYGHTGNTFGYTQFISSSLDGRRSAVVSVNGQYHPAGLAGRRVFTTLRRAYLRAVCASLA